MLNKLISHTLPYLPQKLVWMFSKNYIAGESVEQAIIAARDLNREQTMVTLDILGEFIENMDQAKANRDGYLDLIEYSQKKNINGNFSLKPTMFGLLLDEELCYQYVQDIVAKAFFHDNFIRIDMENSPTVDRSIKLFTRLHQKFPKNVGLVVQAYLKRTLSDLETMVDLKPDDANLNLRLCKGIYLEPPDIAYQDYHTINRHYLEDLEFMLKNNIYPAIATHDKTLITGSLELIEKYNLPKQRYEFQMLYGVTPKQRQELVKSGHRTRVYLPFGKHWFQYSVRRLKENPRMANHIIRAFFKKG